MVGSRVGILINSDTEISINLYNFFPLDIFPYLYAGECFGPDCDFGCAGHKDRHHGTVGVERFERLQHTVNYFR